MREFYVIDKWNLRDVKRCYSDREPIALMGVAVIEFELIQDSTEGESQ